MISEDYVSYEVAKLLKEKGFDCKCFEFYEVEYESPLEKHSQRYAPVNWNDEDDKNCYSRPTLQMAMKWLREVHKLFISIDYDGVDWWWYISSIDDSLPTKDMPKSLKEDTSDESYEEAVEAALKYCLINLI